MTCKAVQERLVLLADDDLPAAEALAVRAHLAECETCAAARREAEGLAAELRSWPRPLAPPELRGRIALAIDAVEASRQSGYARRRSPWETTAFYLAAAAVIALVFGVTAFLSQPRGGGLVASAPPASVLPASRPQAPAPSATSAVPPGPTATGSAATEQQAVADAIKTIEETQKKQALADHDRSLLGAVPPAPMPAGATEPGGKPPGTFAAGGPEMETMQTPTRPVAIELSYLPPERPATDETAHGMVEIVAREDIPKATVTASGDEGLTIQKPGGVLYQGPLRAGESVRVPLPVLATTPGSHEVDIKVESDAPGGNAQLKVFVPGVIGQAAPKPQPQPGDTPVSLVFQNAPIRQALLDIARQGHLRMEMAEGLGTERISRDVRGVPARAAFRAVAEAGGYQVTEASGVFRVSRAAGSR